MKRYGFTLIELLVVIAIIAILAAILFPVFARARAKAQQTACLSNVKQLALGIVMYSSDQNGKFPLWSYNSVADVRDWGEAIQPYVKNEQIYRCPTSRQQPFWPGADYAMNRWLCYDWVNLQFGSSQSEVKQPAKCLMVFDGDLIWAQKVPAYNGPDLAYQWTAGADMLTRHNEGANYGFCDGHAKFLLPGVISRYPISTADTVWTINIQGVDAGVLGIQAWLWPELTPAPYMP